MSDDELESVALEPSDPETQFIPQEDDDETLWEVIEITAEKGKQYKVRWNGHDPKTQKPWPQSWVAKHDCTDDLVRDWKLKQAKKKGSKRESGISKKSRASIATVKSSASKFSASPSKLDSAAPTRRSTSTTTTVTARRNRSKATIPSPSVYKKSTRVPIEVSSPSSHNSWPARSQSPVYVSPTRTSEGVGLGSSANANSSTASTPIKTVTKRKHGETTSTSARITARSTFPTAGTDGDVRINTTSGPPRKKRKLEVELVSNYGQSMISSAKAGGKGKNRKSRSQVVVSDDEDDNYVEVEVESDIELGSEPSELPRRESISSGQAETEEEEEERMIEDALSDIYYSPRRSSPLESSHNHEDEEKEEEGTPIPLGRLLGPMQRREDTAEESTPTTSRPQRRTEKISGSPSDVAGTTLKSDQRSKEGSSPSSSASDAALDPFVSGVASKSRSTTKSSILALQAAANKRIKMIAPIVSRQQLQQELLDFQSQQVTKPEMVLGNNKSENDQSEGLNLDSEGLGLDYPVAEGSLPPPPAKPVLDQAPASISRSKRIGSSDPSAAPSTGIVMPTTPPGNRDSGSDRRGPPVLSPAAKKRLERFDKAVERIALRGKAKGQKPEDGAIADQVTKRREKEQEREIAEAGSSGREQHGFPRTVEEKGWKGKEKVKEDKELDTSTPKPPGIEKKGKPEPLFLPDESDSLTHEEDQEKGKSKPRSISSDTSQPPHPVLQSYDSGSDINPLVRLKHERRRQESKSKSKERCKEQLNQRLPSHYASDSGVESSIKSAAIGRSGSKRIAKGTPRSKPVTRSRSRLADTVEAEGKEDNSFATDADTTNSKLTDKNHICNATSKTLSKTTSKSQCEVDANITQAKPPPSTTSTTTVRRSVIPRSRSFVDDIIPETEESLSQSQEMQVDLQVPKAPIPPTTPSSVNIKSTLGSRMKTKTPQPNSRPLSRSSSAVGALALGVKLNLDVALGNDVGDNMDELGHVSGADNNKKVDKNGATATKLFGPIPRISPSAFTAHLPSSSLPDSIIESTEGDGDDAVKHITDQNKEDDSIEQFESPVKDTTSGLGGERIGILNAVARQGKEKQQGKESALDIWNSDVNRRGRELAEAARKRMKERLRAEEKHEELNPSASTLMERMPQANHAPFGNLAKDGLDRLPDLQEEEMHPDTCMQSLPPDVVLPPQDSVVQQMEDAFVDLSGGIREDRIAAAPAGTAVGASASASAGIEGSQSAEVELTMGSSDVDMDADAGNGVVEQQLDTTYLREEEEESTQDLLMELRLLRQQQRSGDGWGGDHVAETMHGSVNPPPAIQIDSQPITAYDESAQSVDEIPNIIVEQPSRAESARSYSSFEDGNGLPRRKARSRTSKSRSRSRSISSQKGENGKEADPEVEIPATASTHRDSLQALSQPVPQTENVDNPHHLDAAMHLLNTKSEEISKLEGQLSAAQRTNEDLLQQLSAPRLHLQLTKSSRDTQSVTEALEKELAEARAQLALQTSSWESERATLTLNIETVTRNKVSAEQDRDFFREQYARASAFVTSVRDENTELEKQIKIATDQAQSGVSLIKNTFELRTKSLEEDVRAWRRMAEFLIEKDRRTNDDIRRRAAEAPELRAMCDRQEGDLEASSVRLEQLEMALEEKQRMYAEAEEAGKVWKEETVKLSVELSEAKTKLERIGKIGIGDDEHSNDHEFVYRCQWRPDDSNDVCEAVFLNISELQEHLYTGGHLQPD